MKDTEDDTEILYISSCPRRVKRELKEIAKANHRSMEGQAIVFIEEGARRFVAAKEAGILGDGGAS